MAKTKTKKGNKAEKSLVRVVRTKEERSRPSVFLRLKTDEAFKAYAIFEPDPELEDNPGYFEYYDHYDRQANSYVPCAGDRCPFCAANDNPSTRALTVWYFPDAGDVKDQIKVFTMNYNTINDSTDESEDEDGIIGKKVRIKRLDDRGGYKVRIVKGDKALTKSELKKVLKQLEELFPNGLQGLVEKQLKAQMERLKAVAALDDDDNDDEPATKTRKGKAVEDDDNDDDEDEDDEEDEDEEEDDEEDDDDEDDDDDDDDEDSNDDDDDGDDDEDDSDDDESLVGAEVEVTSTNEKDEFINGKLDGNKVKLWANDGVDVDWDTVKKGATVIVNAEKDDEGDWIFTEIAVKGGKGKKGGKKKK